MDKKTKNKNSFLPVKLKKVYNPELDKYENQILFPEKVARAKEMLKGVKIPKQ